MFYIKKIKVATWIQENETGKALKEDDVIDGVEFNLFRVHLTHSYGIPPTREDAQCLLLLNIQ